MDKFLIGIVGVIIGSLLSIIRDYINEYRSKTNNARYLAVRIVGLLDQFISQCVDVACDTGRPDREGVMVPTTKIPTLNFDNIDGEWQSLSFNLMYEVLDFPNHLLTAKEAETFAYEHGDGAPDFDDVFNTRRYHFAILGIRADKLSMKLRNKYGMPNKDYGKWNPISRLNEIGIELKSKNT
ncbi:hypothetical protein [Salinivibrio sharmensis]|uniref:Uncharacterized protein n=1 Tax=Salinivibrio sharmensis TaxID=390883 RepID=A0ABX3KF10_9GAMM|nr:hypothetical protein [Salinivibrio sharmensis]OOE87633.1 hypothetical protein BZG74_10870 [Salinivibrio sharmensis]